MFEFIGFYLSIGAVVSAFEVAMGIDDAFDAAYAKVRYGKRRLVYDRMKSDWRLTETRFKNRMKKLSIILALPSVMVSWPVFLLMLKD